MPISIDVFYSSSNGDRWQLITDVHGPEVIATRGRL